MTAFWMLLLFWFAVLVVLVGLGGLAATTWEVRWFGMVLIGLAFLLRIEVAVRDAEVGRQSEKRNP